MSLLSKLFSRSSPSQTQQEQPPPIHQAVAVVEDGMADSETRLEVFKSHWSQAECLMEKHHGKNSTNVQDFEASLHYFHQMINLISEDVLTTEKIVIGYLFNEQLLEKMVDWTLVVADFRDKFKLQQLRLYELITVSDIIVSHRISVLRPLLRLLSGCCNEENTEVEKKILLVVHQLCVCVKKDDELLSLLFDHRTTSNFLVLTLLTKYVHRDGDVGQQARDSLLLIMSLSVNDPKIGYFISKQSDFCPILATGLSGLYSELPRKLDVPYDDWYQLTNEDITEIAELSMILNSLEFCNAVVQVAHSSIRNELINYIYDGFLVPVLGPALHQDGSKLPSSVVESYCGNSSEEVIAATAYLDLFLRKLSEPALLKGFIKFILTEKHDDTTILESFIRRINSQTRLCQVTLNLFHTLIDLNSEECMFHLIFKYLIPCKHVMVSQKLCVRDLDLYGSSARKFLDLKAERKKFFNFNESFENNLSYDSSTYNTPQKTSKIRFPLFKRTTDEDNDSIHSLNNSFSSTDSMTGNQSGDMETSYSEYLMVASAKLKKCKAACDKWKYKYDGEDPSPDVFIAMPVDLNCQNESIDHSPLISTDKLENENILFQQEVEKIANLNLTDLNSFIESIDALNLPVNFQKRSINESIQEIEELLNREINGNTNEKPSIIEADIENKKEISNSKPSLEVPSHLVYDPATVQESPTLGPFLTAIMSKLDTMMQNSLYVNLVLTGVIARLAIFPQPLLRSLLLNPNLVFQPTIRSVTQVLISVKNKIENFASNINDFNHLMVRARNFLNWRDDEHRKLLSNKLDNTKTSSQPIFNDKTKIRSVTQKPKVSPFSQRKLEKEIKSNSKFSRRSSVESTWGMDAMESVKTKNAVYCAVVLEEFTKELAAICQEHSVI